MPNSIDKTSLSDLIDSGLSKQEISQIYNIHSSSVARLARQYGLSFPAYVQTEETRLLRAEALRKFHEANPDAGKLQTLTAQNILRGKTFVELYGEERAEELSKQQSERLMGTKASAATKKKMSTTRAGIEFSEEWKKNISISRKRGFKNGTIRLSRRAGCGKGGYRQDIGHYVRSTYEHTFARWLKGHAVPYKYEPKSFPLAIDGEATQFTPDFLVNGVWYEIKNPYNVKDEVFNSKLKAFKEQYPEEVIHVIVGNVSWSVVQELKDIDVVMFEQQDLVKIVRELKPLMVVKG